MLSVAFSNYYPCTVEVCMLVCISFFVCRELENLLQIFTLLSKMLVLFVFRVFYMDFSFNFHHFFVLQGQSITFLGVHQCITSSVLCWFRVRRCLDSILVNILAVGDWWVHGNTGLCVLVFRVRYKLFVVSSLVFSYKIDSVYGINFGM